MFIRIIITDTGTSMMRVTYRTQISLILLLFLLVAVMASLTRGSSSGARRRGAGTFTASALSLKSARSVVEKLPKARVCPWAAQWFTVPQLGIKLSEMVRAFGTIAILSHADTGITSYMRIAAVALL